jgi:hypothetical protein
MKNKIALLLTILALFTFTAIAAAKPNFSKPATETGVLHLFDDDDFYINGYELEGLNRTQKQQLFSLVGKTITIKGYYEKKFQDFMIDEIYVNEIIPN